MTDLVQCAECADSYDSEENTFCPRCGATATAKTPIEATRMASRNDPRRRRVQAAGVMMVATGGIMLLLFLATAVLAGQLVPQTMEAIADQPGGDLVVLVAESGVPLEGVTVETWSLDGALLASATTDATGSAGFDDLDHAGIRVRVPLEDGEWTRRVLVLAGGPDAEATVLDAELSDTADADAWVGLDGFVQGSRILAAVFAVIAALTVAGGVAAIRLRGRQLAVGGAVAGLAPWTVLFVASMNIVVLVLVALFVVALVFIRQGRAHFA